MGDEAKGSKDHPDYTYTNSHKILCSAIRIVLLAIVNVSEASAKLPKQDNIRRFRCGCLLLVTKDHAHSAKASAGASLIPSPIIAITLFLFSDPEYPAAYPQASSRLVHTLVPNCLVIASAAVFISGEDIKLIAKFFQSGYDRPGVAFKTSVKVRTATCLLLLEARPACPGPHSH